ncbi:MAG: hypothetical protein AAF828_00620 [Bacteroidota bacterium]
MWVIITYPCFKNDAEHEVKNLKIYQPIMHCVSNSSLDSLGRLFKKVGNPTPHTTDRLKSLQRRYNQILNPHVFHLSLNVRPYPTIFWCHNTERMLGVKRLSYDGYLDRIHPEWLAIHGHFLLTFFRLILTDFRSEAQHGWSLYIKVPLRDSSGKYAWYTQYMRPMEFDHAGRMVSHLSTYTFIDVYDNYRPTGPSVRLDGKDNFLIKRQLQRITEQAVMHEFMGSLRPYEHRTLNVIRRHFAEQGSKKLDLKVIGEELNVSKQAVYKYSYRIMEVTRDCFPVTGIKTIEDLARFLNAQFGKPGLS